MVCYFYMSFLLANIRCYLYNFFLVCIVKVCEVVI